MWDGILLFSKRGGVLHRIIETVPSLEGTRNDKVLDVDKVLLIILADRGEVDLALDPDTFQQCLVTDPRKLKDLGRLDGATTDDDVFSDSRSIRPAAGNISHSCGTKVA